MGWVTAIYRSNEITTKCKIDAVHIQTSTANHILHQTLPKIHIVKTSYIALKGNTTRPSIRSAHAKTQNITTFKCSSFYRKQNMIILIGWQIQYHTTKKSIFAFIQACKEF